MKNQLTEEIKADLNSSVEVLKAGGLVIFPSNVGWLIGCDAVNLNAVSKLTEYVRAFVQNDITVLIDNASKLNAYVVEVPDLAWDLFELSEKPLTISFDSYKNLANNLLSHTKFLGLQVVNESFAHYLCFRYRNPIASCLLGDGLGVFDFSKIQLSIISTADYVVSSYRTAIINNVSSSIIKLSEGNLIEIIKR